MGAAAAPPRVGWPWGGAAAWVEPAAAVALAPCLLAVRCGVPRRRAAGVLLWVTEAAVEQWWQLLSRCGLEHVATEARADHTRL